MIEFHGITLTTEEHETLTTQAIRIRCQMMPLFHPVPNWRDVSPRMQDRWRLEAAYQSGLIERPADA